MKFSKYLSRARRVRFGVASVAAVGLLVALPGTAEAAAVVVPLGTADSFVVLAGQGVTNIGATILNGDLGTSPNPAITGLETVTLNGVVHANDGVAAGAQSDLTAAYLTTASEGPTSPIAADMDGLLLGPGVYNGGALALAGTLTLDAGGDPNAVFVFQASSTLITASGSRVNLINGATSCNVFWQVTSSATLGSGSIFIGTIMALTDVHLETGATVDGRVLARNGEVTLQGNTITRPTCAASGGQVAAVPSGPVSTGDGSTGGGTGDAHYLVAAGVLVLAGAGGAAVVVARRRLQDA